MEIASQIEKSNGPLEERLQELLDLAANKDFYVSETASIQEKINEYTTKFPADVKPEDGIVLAAIWKMILASRLQVSDLAKKSLLHL